ncbi:MAG: hypothetical protein J0G96_03185 [Flavobacteriia bacterium]|nr:hypothetical protein [Flavobacteriia bacterium]
MRKNLLLLLSFFASFFSVAQTLQQADSLTNTGLYRDASEMYQQLMVKAIAQNDAVSFYQAADKQTAVFFEAGYEFKEIVDYINRFPEMTSQSPELKALITHFQLLFLINFYSTVSVEDETAELRLKIDNKNHTVDFANKAYRENLRNYIDSTAYSSIQKAELFRNDPANKFIQKENINPEVFPNFSIYLLDEIKNFAFATNLYSEKVYTKVEDILKAQKNDNSYIIWHLEKLMYTSDNQDTTFIRTLEKFYNEYSANKNALGIQLEINRLKQYQPENQYDFKTNKNLHFQEQSYHLIDSLIKKSPESYYKEAAERFLSEMKRTGFSARINRLDNNHKKAFLSVNYKNLEKVFLHIYKKDNKGTQQFSGESYSEVYSETLQLEQNGKYNTHSKAFIIPDFISGEYLYLLVRDDRFIDSVKTDLYFDMNDNDTGWNYTTAVMKLDDFGYYSSTYNGSIYIRTFDIISNKPIQGIELKQEDKEGRFQTLATTDKNGELTYTFPETTNYRYYNNLQLVRKNSSPQFISIYSGKTTTRQVENIKIITDRKIYRPGEQVSFKAYVYNQEIWNVKPVTETSYTITVKDLNNKELYSGTATTNEYGTLAGNFTLPKSGFSFGSIRLLVGERASYFTVEEYKLPAIQIEAGFDKASYAYSEKLQLKGTVKALAGYMIPNAKVNLSISESSFYWRYYEKDSATDTTIFTDEKGLFHFEFNVDSTERFGKNILATIEVVSENGEIFTSSATTFAGKKQMDWSVELAEMLYSDQPNILKIKSEDTTARFEIDIVLEDFQKKEIVYAPEFAAFSEKQFEKTFGNCRYLKEYKPIELKTVISKKITSKDSILLNELISESGDFFVHVKNLSDDEEKELRFTFINIKEKQAKVADKLWLTAEKEVLEINEKLKYQIGTSAKKMPVTILLFNESGLISKQALQLKGTKAFEYQPTEKDLTGITVQVTGTLDGEVFTRENKITFSGNRKKLDVEWITRRSVLLPGAKEEWQFGLNNVTEAEMLALLVDQANLSMSNNNIEWNPYNNRSIYLRTDKSEPVNTLDFNGYYNNYYYLDDETTYFLPTVISNDMAETPPPSSFADKEVTLSSQEAFNGTGKKKFKTVSSPSFGEGEGSGNGTNEQTPPQIRSNFNETAFFYPQLHAKDGKISFNFTLPDAVTSWNFQTFTHTKEYKLNYFTASIIAKKEVMVQPNVPRFFRQKDKMELTASTVNLSEKEVSATASVEFFNPVTNGIFTEIPAQTRNFNLASNENKIVGWNIEIPTTELPAIGIRYPIKAGTHTDIVERVIVVLSNQMTLSEAVPYTFNTPGTHLMDVKALTGKSKTQQNKQLTIEYLGMPELFVLNSIPTMMEEQNEDFFTLLNKYYINGIAEKLIVQNADLKKRVNDNYQWESPYSKFSDENIRNTLLEETPWVLEAKNEQQQWAKLAAFLNDNQRIQNKTTNWTKLQLLQNSDGSFSWFAKSKGSAYLTLVFAERLQKLGETSGESYKKAIAYLDSEVDKHYQQYKKTIAGDYFSPYLIKWLRITNQNSGESYKYYLEHFKTNWLKYNLSLQAEIGLLMTEKGEKATAEIIWKSIDNRKSGNTTLGTYWQKPKYWWNWYENYFTTHANILELYQKLNKDRAQIAAIRQWLINQKRGQLWETSKTTADICQVLLVNGRTSRTSSSTHLSIGAEQIQLSEKPFSYYKTVIDHPATTSPNIIVEKKDNEPEFAQIQLIYSDDIANITSNTAGLKIEKRLYLVENGKETEITGGKIEKSSKIRVKLFINTDRDLEFVYVKDLRGQGLEPLTAQSGYQSSATMWYYQTSKDASTELFIERLSKGNHQVSYDVIATVKGTIQSGFATAECLYAPEFKANTDSKVIQVE